MTFFKWSKTAANNATADSTCPFPEGMAASALNDGTRGMMAAASKYRDDTAGAIVTGGTATAYTVGTYEGFDTLLNLANQVVAFTPHATNGATVTLNVDGLGAKPLRSAPSTELQAGTLILGTPYVAVYNNADGAFYLHGLYGNPYNVPLGAGMDYWFPTAPNSAFAFPVGQAVSRVTYAAFFAAVGTSFGTGDGSTTFNLPNKMGRVSAMREAAANLLTPTYFGNNSNSIGAIGGSEANTLGLGQIPTNITMPVSVISPNSQFLTAPSVGFGISSFSANAGAQVWQAFSPGAVLVPVTNITSTGSGTSNNTGGQAHANVQPTIICNYIIRVL